MGTTAENLALLHKALSDAKSMGIDYLEATEHHPTCEICSIYADRVYCISGADDRFPKLPDVVYQYGGFHRGCSHSFYPFYVGITERMMSGHDPIEWSNRPFVDSRSQEEIDAYNEDKERQEIDRMDRLDYDWLRENLPDCAPKSFGGYRRMKNQNSINYQKLEKTALENGRVLHQRANTGVKELSVKSSNVVDDLEATTNIWNKGKDEIDVEFPSWYISVSFGRSTSPSFVTAVTLASNAPIFIKGGTEKQPIFQAVYSDKPQEYLAFIQLYEIVKSWKTTFVVINGKLIDRKIIGKLNYCYGDRCRSGNPSFCFGASPDSENPFGCHRLQMSAINHPWYSFGKISPHSKHMWLVDKPAIIERAESFAQVYSLCPVFDWDRIREEISNLPDTIDLNEHKEYELTDEGLRKPHVIRVVFEGITENADSVTEKISTTAEETSHEIRSIEQPKTVSTSEKNLDKNGIPYNIYENYNHCQGSGKSDLDEFISQYRNELKIGAIISIIVSAILFAIADPANGEGLYIFLALIGTVLLALAIIILVKIKKTQN